jgi:hypothetical protein
VRIDGIPGSSYYVTLLFPSYISAPLHHAIYLRVWDKPLSVVYPNIWCPPWFKPENNPDNATPKRRLALSPLSQTTTHPSPTTSSINPNIQPKESNTPFTVATTNQNSGGARHIQASLRAPPPHIINKEQKQAAALRA